jgi:hypothetical protein
MAAVAPRGNLDTRAQETQMRFGLVALAASLVVAVVLAQSGASAGFRAVAFVPFFVAAYGVTSALYRTCGLSALAGRRQTSDGAEPVADRSELRAQRRAGLRVFAVSGALAGVATLLFSFAH